MAGSKNIIVQFEDQEASLYFSMETTYENFKYYTMEHFKIPLSLEKNIFVFTSEGEKMDEDDFWEYLATYRTSSRSKFCLVYMSSTDVENSDDSSDEEDYEPPSKRSRLVDPIIVPEVDQPSTSNRVDPSKCPVLRSRLSNYIVRKLTTPHPVNNNAERYQANPHVVDEPLRIARPLHVMTTNVFSRQPYQPRTSARCELLVDLSFPAQDANCNYAEYPNKYEIDD